MRLYSFQIKNFKSIIDTGNCKISNIDNIVVLAGQNESGKSAALEALDFFANGPSKKFEKFEKRHDGTTTEVRCTFLIGQYDKDYYEGKFENYKEVQQFLKKKNEVVLIRTYQEKQNHKISIDEKFFADFPEIEKKELENKKIDPSETANSSEIVDIEIKSKKELIDQLSEIIIGNMYTVLKCLDKYFLVLPYPLSRDFSFNKNIINFRRRFIA